MIASSQLYLAAETRVYAVLVLNSTTFRGEAAVVAGILAMAVPGILLFSLPGLFIPYWKDALGATNAQLGWVTTVAVLSSGIFTYVAGVMRGWWGTRMMYVISLLMQVTALSLLLIFPHSLTAVYVWAAIGGISTTFAYSPSLSAVQEWFPLRGGLVTGMINVSFAGWAALASPIIAGALARIGFQATLSVLVGATIAFSIVAILLSTPKQVEFARLEELAAFSRSKNRVELSQSLTVSQAVRSASFWQMWVIWFAAGAATISMLPFSATYATYLNEHGVPVNTAAVITAFAIGNALIRIVIAAIIDRVCPVIIAACAFFGVGAGYLALTIVEAPTVLVVVALVAGIGLGTMFTTAPALLTPIFGIRYFGQIFGLVFAAYGIFGALAGPMVSSYLQESIGFHYAFVYLSALGFLAFAAVLAQGYSRHRIVTSTPE
ncbi:MFS transporter [Arcanobacterium canis]|uniref:MFS transporter n=1 Tax=Arcanobacterium canis TaxID=999183 RepID=A0ABY8FZF5_9ACTO|nr:MFS transporter [Arcanobacterium canis]WFM82950.1 MFS transporter [Arcanobacterium canis]